jgi:hypothetical protein
MQNVPQPLNSITSFTAAILFKSTLWLEQLGYLCLTVKYK